MRYLAILLGVALVAPGVVGASVGAQAQLDIHIDDHFQDEFWSETCGVDVFIDIVADVKVTLVYNRSGLVVRETDKAGAARSRSARPTRESCSRSPSNPRSGNMARERWSAQT